VVAQNTPALQKNSSIPDCVPFEEIFKRLGEVLTSGMVADVNGVLQLNIIADASDSSHNARDQVWTLDLQKGSGSMYEGVSSEPADTIITLSDETMGRWINHRLDPIVYGDRF
jgi:hypothetical protein